MTNEFLEVDWLKNNPPTLLILTFNFTLISLIIR